MKTTTFITKINEIEYNIKDAGESFSALSLNPTFAWAKFILTDDEKNANNQRIPKEEFPNLLRTGVFAPFKMAEGETRDDHSGALPLGVITHLKEIDNHVECMAALWTRERETDVQLIKDQFASGKAPQISWEILYEDSKIDENGVENLLGTSLRAATLVGMPAYAGRTPVLAMASKNSNTEGINVEELEQLRAKVTELEATLATKTTELDALKVEAASLREYKEAVEKEKKASARMAEIKKKFSDANIEKDDTFYTEKRETLLGLDEAALDFMVQELIAFAAKSKDASASDKDKKPEIPNLPSDPKKDSTPKELAEELRKLHLK